MTLALNDATVDLQGYPKRTFHELTDNVVDVKPAQQLWSRLFGAELR